VRREYPETPIVAVGVIILDGDRVLLIRRDKEPARGLWTFPGGAVELGEPLHDAARREALEETGLHVGVGEVATVIDSIVYDEAGRIQYHYVIVDYFAHPTGGRLEPGTDVSAARWFRLSELDGIDMTEKAGVLARQLLEKPSQA
jgi:8-oxo-dGTP diphosphatase